MKISQMNPTSSHDFKIFSSLFRMYEATSWDQVGVEETCSFWKKWFEKFLWIEQIK